MLASRKGVPLDAQMSAIVYENVLLVLAASMYAVILLADLGKIPIYLWAVLAMLLPLLYTFFNRVSIAVNRLLRLLMRQLISHRLTKRFAARFRVSFENPIYAGEKSFLSLSRLFCVQPLHYGPLILAADEELPYRACGYLLCGRHLRLRLAARIVKPAARRDRC